MIVRRGTENSWGVVMHEGFYKAASGKIIFSAIQSVGVDHSVSFAPVHGWNNNGFPQGHPTDLGRETILDALGIPEHKSPK